MPLHPWRSQPSEMGASPHPANPQPLAPHFPPPRMPGFCNLSLLRVDFPQTLGLESHLPCVLKSAAQVLQAL